MDSDSAHFFSSGDASTESEKEARNVDYCFNLGRLRLRLFLIVSHRDGEEVTEDLRVPCEARVTHGARWRDRISRVSKA